MQTSQQLDNRVVIEEVPHSTRGASSAHRWLACKGSINLISRLEREGKKVVRTNIAAAEGTAAHTLLASCLEDGSDAWEAEGLEFTVGGWTFVVDDEMANGVQMTLDFVRQKLEQHKDKNPVVYIEKSLSSIIDEDAWGTPDTVILVPGERMIVVDFKYGRGVTVEPNSDQNRYYGYLACENYLEAIFDVDVVELWIAQPRIPHPKGLLRRHVTNPAELEDWWMNVLIPGIQETRNPNALLTIGEHCRFCPAKELCPALKKEAFEFTVNIPVDHLTGDELGHLIEKGKAILKFMETLESEAFRRMVVKGEPVWGQKVVRKKANRIFKEQIVEKDEFDEPITLDFGTAAIHAFGDDAYEPPTFRSPPSIEKLPGGKDFVAKWAYKPDTGLTIAPLSDKREAVRPLMEQFLDQQADDQDEAF